MARSPSGGRWRRRAGRAGPVSARAVRGCAIRVLGIPVHRVAGQGRHHGRLRSGQHLSGEEGYAGTVRGLRHPGVARCECLAAGGHRQRVPGRRGRRFCSGVLSRRCIATTSPLAAAADISVRPRRSRGRRSPCSWSGRSTCESLAGRPATSRPIFPARAVLGDPQLPPFHAASSARLPGAT